MAKKMGGTQALTYTVNVYCFYPHAIELVKEGGLISMTGSRPGSLVTRGLRRGSFRLSPLTTPKEIAPHKEEPLTVEKEAQAVRKILPAPEL